MRRNPQSRLCAVSVLPGGEAVGVEVSSREKKRQTRWTSSDDGGVGVGSALERICKESRTTRGYPAHSEEDDDDDCGIFNRSLFRRGEANTSSTKTSGSLCTPGVARHLACVDARVCAPSPAFPTCVPRPARAQATEVAKKSSRGSQRQRPPAKTERRGRVIPRRATTARRARSCPAAQPSARAWYDACHSMQATPRAPPQHHSNASLARPRPLCTIYTLGRRKR